MAADGWASGPALVSRALTTVGGWPGVSRRASPDPRPCFDAAAAAGDLPDWSLAKGGLMLYLPSCRWCWLYYF
jgi:hypothetical protein